VLVAGGRNVRSLPAALLADACRDGWEGLIANRVGTPYVSTRYRDWL
jgi:ATP-dependent DNA ligase